MAFHIGQIHGAGIDWQGIFDPVNNDAQGVSQMCCGADFLYDLSQSNKHRDDSFIPSVCVVRRLNSSLFALLAPCPTGASTPKNVNILAQTLTVHGGC